MKFVNFAKFVATSKFFALMVFTGFLLSACNFAIESNGIKTFPKSAESNSASANTTEEKNNKKVGDALFEKNRQLWVDKKVSNYDFVASLVTGGFSYPADPVRIRVRNQKVVSVERLTKEDERDVFYYDDWATVEKLFDKITDESQQGQDVSVKYNKEFGYPEEIGITMRETTAWSNFKVKSFEIVNLKD